ncbi:phosphate/phosphite/phosphonate ABC transporter substrate-binding protein [Desulfobacula toluolica]|uniref:PhnD: phosphonate ABC transporter, periplasmic phosphonate-binding protein n=1 Tax=Desulfobacula toluolica (strain DSM 7467 / Tol2) TaxID=651182 RepID=K0NCN4_DESTT|nr:phosphate/phosphite/phosphonate ABC transporter substrate-binding protein [Desulfobacula toluolica]CCK78591.1 PhnD: phosphonate ABC transporter, periplasmic phosphonate-binding protein [Desulfobacula toluolica Tol2]
MKYVWGVFLFFLLFSGCRENESAVTVDLTITEQVTLQEEPGVVTYAYLPQYSHTESYMRHHSLVQYLQKETKLNIRQIFPDTFDEHMKMVGQKKIDISYSNPFIYVKIAHRYGARAFARIVEPAGKDKFRGQIICRKDNTAIQNLADCRQKRWIAVDSTSAGGYLYPLGHFIDHGIRKTDFKEIAFAPGPGGKQEKVILSVYAGKYDMGTIRQGSLDVMSDKIDINQIRIISVTKPYPGWVYAARKDLDKQIVQKLKQALEKLDFNHKTHRDILEAANFIRVMGSIDSDFNSVRQLADRVGINLEE